MKSESPLAAREDVLHIDAIPSDNETEGNQQPCRMLRHFFLPVFFFACVFCFCIFFCKLAYFDAGLRAVCCRLLTMSVSLH